MNVNIDLFQLIIELPAQNLTQAALLAQKKTAERRGKGEIKKEIQTITKIRNHRYVI